MADYLSRFWHLSNAALLDYFNANFPQSQPWKLANLRPEMLSALISALQMKRVEPASLLNAPRRKIVTGASGKISAPLSLSAPTCKASPNSFLFSRYSPPVLDRAPSHHPKKLSHLSAFRTTFAPSVRKSPAWGPKIRVLQSMAN